MATEAFWKVSIRATQRQQEILLSHIDTGAFLGAEQSDETLIVWLNDQSSIAQLEHVISAKHDDGSFVDAVVERVEQVPAEDWLAAWRRSLEPVCIGDRIRIVPFADWEHPREGIARTSHIQICSPSDSKHVETIVIEPKMAFGTGHHATTQLCIELLLDTVEPGTRWIDIGTGTGVLAIVAVRLGASHVLALDSDPEALENAAENLSRNGCRHMVTLVAADATTYDYPPADGIVANLHDVLLVQLGDRCAASLGPGGWLIVSGILDEQATEVEDSLQKAGFVSERMLTRDQWVALRLRRP